MGAVPGYWLVVAVLWYWLVGAAPVYWLVVAVPWYWLVCRGEFLDLSSWGQVPWHWLERACVSAVVRRERGGFLSLERDLGVPGEAWRGIQSVLLAVASCGVGGLRHDDGSSRIRIGEVAGLLAWFLLAAGPSLPDSCNQLIDSGRSFVLLVGLFVVREKTQGAWRGLGRGVDRPGETWRGLERERESL